MPLDELHGIFPNLIGNSKTITSKHDCNYNCTSWALDENDKNSWWEPYGIIIPAPPPIYHWHNDIPHNESPQTYVMFFEKYGFEVTDNLNLEEGFEKVVLYVRINVFQHVARQLPNGRWTSKLGKLEDIEHDLSDLESEEEQPCGYGAASIFLKKRKKRNENSSQSDGRHLKA